MITTRGRRTGFERLCGMGGYLSIGTSYWTVRVDGRFGFDYVRTWKRRTR
tara:strand:- start:37 stop:186 length:150 start_codon:yes stop_codon:yes gene_type:complete